MDFCFSFSSCDGSHKTLTGEKKAMGLNTEPTNLRFLLGFCFGSLRWTFAAFVWCLCLRLASYKSSVLVTLKLQPTAIGRWDSYILTFCWTTIDSLQARFYLSVSVYCIKIVYRILLCVESVMFEAVLLLNETRHQVHF